MTLFRCPDCREMISRSAASCPKCGTKITAEILKQDEENTRVGLRILGIGGGILFAIFGLYWAANSTYRMIVDGKQIDVNGKTVTVGECKADIKTLHQRAMGGSEVAWGACGTKARLLLETALEKSAQLSRRQRITSAILDANGFDNMTRLLVGDSFRDLETSKDEAWAVYRTEIEKLEALVQ